LYTAGSTHSGTSKVEVNSSTFGTGANTAVKVVGLSGDPENQDTTANIATYSAGDTTSGISNVALDGGSFATSSGSNFAVYALSTDVDNSDYTVANANILVRINKHQYRDTTGI
jgi:hypothetical protein